MAQKTMIGIDAGGTFTDFVAIDAAGMRSCKVLSTPDNPARAILEGVRLLGLENQPCQVVHGTTVGTNAVLEGKGARVAFITNKGFADLLTLGRQQRRGLFELQQPAPLQPVPDELCLELDARVASDGTVLQTLQVDDLEKLEQQLAALDVDAVAITLLFSFLYPELEQQVQARLAGRWFVSRSSQVLPVIREYERGIATWLNSYVGPLLAGYLDKLRTGLPRASVSVMQSAGTTIEAGQAANHAVRMLLSGPAGGLSAASFLGEQMDCQKMLSFDMGGTSTDVALIDGRPELTSRGQIAGIPVAVPMVDMHTIGAGGGSIARVDRGGLLLVGPESAGAWPGPACYGNGGEQVTVTDAHVVLGRIPPDTRLGGRMALQLQAAQAGMETLAKSMACTPLQAARGVIRLANEHMARALRVISIERGHNPRQYTLFSFGGAGGLHVCELAAMLGISQAIVPASSGVLSALGMLVSPPGRVMLRPVLEPLAEVRPDAIARLFDEMAGEAGAALAAEGVAAGEISSDRIFELRYCGQEHALSLEYGPLEELAGRFHDAHENRFGHRLDLPVELVNLRLQSMGRAALNEYPEAPPVPAGKPRSTSMPELEREVPAWELPAMPEGQTVRGPAIIRDASATTWVAPGWSCRKDRCNHLRLSRD